MYKAVALLGIGCLLGFSAVPRRSRILMRVQIRTEDGWTDLGEIKSMIAVSADGTKVIELGKKEDLFDLQLTDSDRQLLKDIDEAMG